MASTFSRLHPRLQSAIVARLGWTSLRAVQEEAGDAILGGSNAVVLAPTAGGKTEASLFPTLSMLLDNPTETVGALYIAPIKALLNNQAERLGRYTEMVGLDRMVWHGDVGSGPRKRFLKEPTELLMTTPESLEVMLVSTRVDARKLFADLRIVVIDEVHALAGSDRGAHLMSVLERLNALSKHDLQRVGLSATVGNPEAILGWLGGSSERPGLVVDPPKPPARRKLLILHRPDLADLATDASKLARGQKSLLFCQSRAITESVADTLNLNGTRVYVHHSAVSKEERDEAEANFHKGSNACIVCTSTLELGIDVGDLDAVLQAEAPDTVGSFLQRMGRTGRRAGQAANMTFLCTTGYSVLQSLALIELAKKGWVEDVDVQDRCWPVLVHQLFALSLAGNGVTAEAAWRHLSRVPDLQGIHRSEFDRLLHWMVRDRSLDHVDGRLLLGPKAEKKFGRRNFMELYAVFSSPVTYKVETTNKRPLGTLGQSFVDQLVEGTSSFLLAGRAWTPMQISHSDRLIVVQPAPRGRMPKWGGATPQFLGFDLCQAMRELLLSDEVSPVLHESAAEVLAGMRAGFSDLLDSATGGIQEEDDALLWWTFAGGRVNNTLKYALLAVGGDWKVSADNFRLKIKGAGLTRTEFKEAIDDLKEIEPWQDQKLWEEVAKGLPAFRLSKFQAVMPEWASQEIVATFLLDIERAWTWVSQGQDIGDAGSLAFVGLADDSLPPPPEELESLEFLQPRLPIRWVRTEERLAELCAELKQRSLIALDVETTLRDRSLCLVQLGDETANYLIDPLEISDLSALAELMGHSATRKLIHNASFERQVLGRLGIEIRGVIDTLKVSRGERGYKIEGGHSLARVSERELGQLMDKTEQTSRWTRRPLTDSQVRYAALDVEVLMKLAGVFGEELQAYVE